eukprot:scaffold34954_cov42-Attheya_sp.AAC.2
MWEKDRRLLLTTSTAGFHGANHVEPPAPVAPPVLAATINAELETLRAKLQAIRQHTLSAPSPQPPAAPAPTPRPPAVNTLLAEMGYCWTHGYSGNLAHTSVSCVNWAAGHQQNATHANRIAGTERIWLRDDRRTPR